jgi:hypothetical protein
MGNKWLTGDQIEEMAMKPYFAVMYPGKITLLREGLCTDCGKEVTGFKNDLERREYGVSGMCRNCQMEAFKENYQGKGE